MSHDEQHASLRSWLWNKYISVSNTLVHNSLALVAYSHSVANIKLFPLPNYNMSLEMYLCLACSYWPVVWARTCGETKALLGLARVISCQVRANLVRYTKDSWALSLEMTWEISFVRKGSKRMSPTCSCFQWFFPPPGTPVMDEQAGDRHWFGWCKCTFVP
jgi:hypothetical protein